MASKEQIRAAKQRVANAQQMKKVIGGAAAERELQEATAELQALTGLGWR